MKKRKRLRKFPHQFFYFLGLRIRRSLVGLSSMMVPAQMAVLEKAQGYWISRAIYTACELNLADHLSSVPKPIAELASLSGTDEQALYRLMRALAGEGVFRELSGKRFTNTRMSQALKDHGDSVKYLVMHLFDPTSRVYLTSLPEAVRQGGIREGKLSGKDLYELMRADREKSDIYDRSMDESSDMISLALLSAYSFQGIKTLVDVGGGRGVLLSKILEDQKGMRGILFDMPNVNAPAEKNFRQNGTLERVSIVSGDFFEDIPAGAEAYLMKNILHAFNDEDCIRLLGKIRTAMAPGGKIIILEAVLRPDNKPAFGKLFDLLMLTGTEGGKERTGEEYEELCDRAGLRITRIVRTVAPFSVIEAAMK
jgi:hypothetical protein